jgi:phosphatidylcholine synthase
MTSDAPRSGPRIRPFLVHVLTACGAACAFVALLAAVERDWVGVFAWLGVALVIDGIDGTLARRFHVAELLPRWSGDALDLVVDFTTYVFVPAFTIATSGLVPDIAAIPLALAVVVSSALYFVDDRMKTADNYFHGFPALWNAVAFYLLILKPPEWVSALLIVVLVILTFVPLRVIHPFRVVRLRLLNIGVLVVWSALAIYALISGLAPGPWVSALLVAIGVYFLGAGFFTAQKDT